MMDIGGREFIEKAVFYYLQKEGEASTSELSLFTGLPIWLIYPILRGLEDRGMVEREERYAED